MATAKQLQANRENSRKSTGPSTEAGKETSSRNALRHGLAAEHHFVQGEDPELFKELCSSLADQAKPVTVIEKLLVNRIAATLWRLRRVPAIEAAVIEALSHPRDQSLGDTGAVQRIRTKRGRPPISAKSAPAVPPNLTVGQAFEIALSNNILDKISRYDAALMNQLIKTGELLNHSIYQRQQQMLAEAIPKKPTDVPLSAEEGWKKIKLG